MTRQALLHPLLRASMGCDCDRTSRSPRPTSRPTRTNTNHAQDRGQTARYPRLSPSEQPMPSTLEKRRPGLAIRDPPRESRRGVA
jgi:hypothetical protein